MDKTSVKVMNSLSEVSSRPNPSQKASNPTIPNKSVSGDELQSSCVTSKPGSCRLSSDSRPTTQTAHTQVVYTPRLKKVLKSYQASAITSLNGPDWVSNRMNSVSSSPNSSSSSVSSPLPSLPNMKSTAISESASRSAVSTTNIRFGEQPSHSSVHKNKNSDHRNSGTKTENYDPFLAPPPFPIQQPPIFTPPDQNRCERSETILEGETISCFTVGGEKRLCLPQILTTVLRDFSLPQINSVCDDLQIFCSRCTMDQLEVLKLTGIIPVSAPSCGLITKTDAERLCAALLYSNPPKAAFSCANGSNGKRLLTVKVYHQCFGKCIGLYVPSLYVQPFSTCIECLECHGLFAPQKFVCHSHRSKENRTCHWGFDSSNWRAYLLLAKDNVKVVDENHSLTHTEHLNQMKSRFDFKRKIPVTPGDDNQVCDPIKRVKCEDTTGLYPYPSYLFSPYSWATDPSLLMYWYPALASGASNNSSSSIAARLSAFKPWSPSSIGNGKNLSQVMPPGYNSSLQSHKFSCEPPRLQTPEKASKRLDRYIKPSLGLVGSAPQTSHNTTTSVAHKDCISTDKCKSVRDGLLYDDNDSFSSNTFSSENSNLSDDEISAKSKSGKIFGNLENILEENKLSQDLKLKIITEVENIISKLGNIDKQTNIHHKKKILNGIQANKMVESLKLSQISGRHSTELGKKCSEPMTGPSLSGHSVVSHSCSPTLIKREPNSSPILADPKINCVH